MTDSSDSDKTWSSIKEMRRGMSLMLQDNPYFAWQYVRGEDAPYRPSSYLNQLISRDDDIFNGRKTPGFYAIRPDNTTRWGASDFDSHGITGSDWWRSEAERTYEKLSARVDECWFLETHPGGYHIIAFSNDFIPASEFRRVISDVTPQGVEVFPKQDQLKPNDPNSKGSLLRFPGRHLLKRNWSKFLCKTDKRIQVTDLHTGSDEALKSPSEKGRLESLYQVATRNIVITQPGQRFNAMQKIVGRLKGRAKSEDDAIWVYKKWHYSYQRLISTPLRDAIRDFLAWYRKASPCNSQIPDYPLSHFEESALRLLPVSQKIPQDHQETLIRLYLNARQHSQVRGEPNFWVSCRTISEKLEISIPTAWRYTRELERLRIVEAVKRGHTGRATSFRFIHELLTNHTS
jgi:hypothetical protein